MIPTRLCDNSVIIQLDWIIQKLAVLLDSPIESGNDSVGVGEDKPTNPLTNRRFCIELSVSVYTQ